MWDHDVGCERSWVNLMSGGDGGEMSVRDVDVRRRDHLFWLGSTQSELGP